MTCKILRATACLAALFCLLAGAPARGDVVVLKNGDRLSGKVKSLVQGTLTLELPEGGEAKIPAELIQSITSEETCDVKLADGSLVKGRLEAPSAADRLRVAPEGDISPVDIPLGEVVSINEPVRPPVRHTASLSFGGILTDGNNNTKSADADLEFKRESDDDSLTIRGRTAYRETEGETDLRNSMGSLRYQLQFTPRFYRFIALKLEQDKFQDIGLRTETSLGAGYSILKTPADTLDLETGPTYVRTDFRRAEDEEYISSRFAETYTHAFSEENSFYQEAEYLPDAGHYSNYRFNAEAGVKSRIHAQWSLKAYVRFQYNSNPPDTVIAATGRSVGRKDTTYGVNLVYNF